MSVVRGGREDSGGSFRDFKKKVLLRWRGKFAEEKSTQLKKTFLGKLRAFLSENP